ncbi:MAG: helix-turn-helix domain-containing protein [Bauldia sp.]|nr:helix-turn-helix domain-containing protein [Bauldia sp.]
MLYEESLHVSEADASRPARARTFSGAVSLAEAFGGVGISVRHARNSEVYGEGEPVDNVYKVVSGAVRTYKLLSDGRRQISDFHIQGDVFGLEIGTERHFTAEAIADSVVLVAKRSVLVSLAGRSPELASELWAHTAKELKRAQDHLLLLGRKRAQERVATFLLDMAGREGSDIVVDLPMSRQDIADYLGLTIETVSRTLTRLEGEMAIEIPTSRRILLRDRQALGHLNN